MPITGFDKTRTDKYYSQIQPGNIATRMITGRVATTITNTVTRTYQVTTALAQQCDAVRIIIANNYKQASFNVNTVAASAIGSTSDLNNSSGTNWNSVGGSPLPTAPVGGTVDYGLFFSQWIPCQSVPRTDGGTFPLIVLRVVMGLNSLGICSYGDGTDTFTNWATKSDGKIWVARSMDGSFAASPSGFTSTTNENASPILGVQYSALGKVITVMGIGDSITEGRGTYFGEGFNLPAVQALSNPNNVAIEYANCGWSGQSPIDFYRRGRYLIESRIAPDVIVIPSNSPNVVSPLTAAAFQTSAGLRGALMTSATKKKIGVLMWTMTPVNTAVHAWGTSDSFRTSDNANLVAQAAANPHFFVADLATAMQGSQSSGQYQFNSSYTTDGIHPNDAGNAVCASLIQAQLKKMLGL